MNWIEVKLNVDGESAEAVADLLQRYGHQGIYIEQSGIIPDHWDEDQVPPPQELTICAYFLNDERADSVKAQLEDALAHMSLLYPMPRPTYTVLDETDWSQAWKAHYHPLRIGRNILIRPLWVEDLKAEPDDIVVSLDPGMAFGTGTHPTTQLCLVALENLIGPGMRVLDLGSGSGILSIAAARLGAASVLALDTDPIAIRSTQENATYNNVADKIIAQVGSLESVRTSSRRFDLIVVNILANVIIEMCSQGLGQTVRPGGLAIFSGIIQDQADSVEDALQATGLIPDKKHQDGDWIAIEAHRPH
jgi:ribosomal protein L11 methyltransferase